MKHLAIILSIFFWMKIPKIVAQPIDFSTYNEQHLQIRKGVMWTLGSWAVVNISGGMILRSQQTGSNRYFHEMNAIWNTVNLGIALPSLISAYKTDVSQIDRITALKSQQAIERVLMLNIGLNTGYIAGGAYLIERSKRLDTNIKPARLKGYGQSLLLQGGFLLLFDITQYLLYHRNGKKVGPALLGQLRITGQGLSLSYRF